MDDYGQGEVEDWKNITKILALENTSFGVKEDGTVVASGRNVCDMTYVSNKNPIELIQFWWSATKWNDILNGRG